MTLVSRRELGRRTNISESTIRDYIKYGKITMQSFSSGIHGKGDLIYEIAVSELLKIRPDLKDFLQEKEPLGTSHTSQKSKNNPNKEKADKEDVSYADAERREKIAKAQLAELDLEEKLGTLVNISDVKKALYVFGAEIRDAILAVPNRITDSIVACDDRNEAHLMLTKELNDAILALTYIENRKLSK
jgi:hypothetical protein